VHRPAILLENLHTVLPHAMKGCAWEESETVVFATGCWDLGWQPADAVLMIGTSWTMASVRRGSRHDHCLSGEVDL